MIRHRVTYPERRLAPKVLAAIHPSPAKRIRFAYRSLLRLTPTLAPRGRRLLLAALLAAPAVPLPLAAAENAPETPAAPASAPPIERRVTRQVAPGIPHQQVVREAPPHPLVVNVLRADLRQPGWRLQVWPGKDVLITPDVTKGREAVGKLALRRGALAAINGDYFGNGDPLGLQITDGELLSEPYPNRCAFGLTRDGRTLWGPVRLEATVSVGGRSFPVKGINRARGANELIVYTPRYGSNTGANAAGVEVAVEWPSGPVRAGVAVTGTVSEIRPGRASTPIPPEGFVLSGHGAAANFLRAVNTADAVSLRINLIGEGGQSWNEVWQAVGGGPRLIKNGEVCLGGNPEQFRPDVLNGRNPRSAIALTRDSKLLLVAVDGRQPLLSGGVTLAELAEWLRAEGAVEAMNLDGGGSTTFALRNVVVNSPSQGTQRLVANAVLIFTEEPSPAEEGELALLPPEGAVAADGRIAITAGSPVRFRAARRQPDGTWQELPEDAVTWALEGQIGRLTQDGTLLGMRAGPGAVSFSTGQHLARAEVITVAGPPARVTAALEPAANGSGTVRARVVDAYGNAVPEATLTLAYTTGEGPQTAEGTTDARGEVRLPLPLAALAAETPVTVSAGTAPPFSLKIPGTAAASTAAKNR